LALNVVSPAAVSAFAGALNRHVPAKSVPTNVSVQAASFCLHVLVLLHDFSTAQLNFATLLPF